jgi:multicomponent Na+:H+ antiporter subunit C
VTLLLAATIATLFGSGAYLLVKRDLIRVVGGVILLSNAANLFIVAAGLSRGVEPIYPLPAGDTVSDPLVQALVLTAIVIGFGTVSVLLGLIYRIYAGVQAEQRLEEPEPAQASTRGDED